MQTHPQRIYASNIILGTQFGLNDAEDGLNDGGLSGARPAHNTHFGMPLYGDVEILDD